MILCIDKTAIKEAPEVQKDIDLEDLLVNHTKYFETEEEANIANYAPLNFSVSVRSLYTNKVVCTRGEQNTLYYTNLTNVQEFPHKGYDLLMYLTSIALMSSVDYRAGFDDLMMRHSQFQPVGLFYSPFVNPIVYTHILVSDEGIEELAQFLKPNKDIVTIAEMRDNTAGNIVALLDTLIEVKEEHKDEPDNNN